MKARLHRYAARVAARNAAIRWQRVSYKDTYVPPPTLFQMVREGRLDTHTALQIARNMHVLHTITQEVMNG